MARRSRDWNEGLAQDLRDQKFARDFLLAAMDEGVPIQIALGKVIRAMGVKEFLTTVKMAALNVLRAIHPRHNPTQGESFGEWSGGARRYASLHQSRGGITASECEREFAECR
jgi:DNA-binding phage protein